jgi:hypothetical protein
MAWYCTHDFENSGINVVAANCVARIAHLGFDCLDHLRPLDCVILLGSASGHTLEH